MGLKSNSSKSACNSDSEFSDNSSESNHSKQCDDEPFDPIKFFGSAKKEFYYYKMVNKFFKICPDNKITKMIDIITGKSNISLRILDWFVTKYSKKRIDYNNGKDTEIFDVRISYKSQLKSYKKRYFDPFRRRERFVYSFGDDGNRKIETTLGQLNFFKWAFSNNILEYIDKNLKQISKEMNLANKEDKKKKKQKLEDSKNSSDEKKSKSPKDNDKKPTKKSKSKKSDNIKINAVKTTDDMEVKIVLKFD